VWWNRQKKLVAFRVMDINRRGCSKPLSLLLGAGHVCISLLFFGMLFQKDVHVVSQCIGVSRSHGFLLAKSSREVVE
jgi:hypothetical protein